MPVSPTPPTSHRRARPLRRLLAAAVLLATVLATFAIGPGASPAAAATTSTTAEQDFALRVNAERRSRGLAPLYLNSSLASTSRSWSGQMRSAGKLSHDPNLTTAVARVVPDWRRAGENVGVGYSVTSLHDAFMASAGHRANVLGDYNQVGVGVVVGSDGKIWVTFRFVLGSIPAGATSTPYKPDRIGIRRDNTSYLRRSLSPGPASYTFDYGTSSDVPVTGDWDGNGTATPGVFRKGVWYLRNSNSTGAAQIAASFGSVGAVPLVGDWDGDGKDSIGVWRDGTVSLRNSNTSGSAHVTFTFGQPGDVPLAGDWNGDGKDTIGVRRGSTFMLRDANSGGAPSRTFSYGASSDVPVVGDWDGNRTDTVGVRRGNVNHLRNSNTSGGASVSFSYGTSSDKVVVAGSW